jgi:hypothetical protein
MVTNDGIGMEWTLHRLGVLCYFQGKLRRCASGHCKERRSMGSRILSTINNLTDRGKFDETEKMYQWALQRYDSYEKAPDRTSTLSAVRNLLPLQIKLKIASLDFASRYT